MLAQQAKKLKIKTQTGLFQISALLINPDTGKLQQIKTETGDVFEFLAVTYDGQIFISKDQVADESGQDILGLKAKNIAGDNLGNLVDFNFSENDGFIKQYIIRPKFIGPDRSVPRKKILKITSQEIIIDDKAKALIKNISPETIPA